MLATLLALLLGAAPPEACAGLARPSAQPIGGFAVRNLTAAPIGAALRFCRVTGTIAPEIRFELDLPLRRWSGRYLQTGCGGLCGVVDVHLQSMTGCVPATDGTLAVASDDLGHEGADQHDPAFGPAADAAFGRDPQARIDFAYRANHATALVAKALIARFYRRPPTASYFAGCSDGGREALIEAERFPDDFDGIAAGAAAMNFEVQNSFYHAWMARANTDAAGHPILTADRAAILHRAVIAACDTLDGDRDGLLGDPRLCHFDPARIQCATDTDRGNCLSADEVAAARKLYAGPTDAAGRHFTPGGPMYGSELAWAGVFVPLPGNPVLSSAVIARSALTGLIFPKADPAQADLNRFAFTGATFARLAPMHALYDATNPDLTSFIRHGGKLILYHGWSDPHISPLTPIAYWNALGTTLGANARDSAVRLFLFPGMYHCRGGDGFWQFDVLTPLIRWVEQRQPPERILATATRADKSDLPAPLPPGPRPLPLPPPALPARAARPIYPYPLQPRYLGHGDPDAPSSWAPAPPPAARETPIVWLGADFFRPGFQKTFTVQNGLLTAAP